MPGEPRGPKGGVSIERWILRELLGGASGSASAPSGAELHAVARSLNGKVLADDPRIVGRCRNHERAVLEIRRAHRPLRLFVLVGEGSCLAFADADVGPHAEVTAMTYRFLDVPEVAALMATDREVLTRAQLERRFDRRDPRMRSALDAGSLADLDYWRPGRIGDVLFNYWD